VEAHYVVRMGSSKDWGFRTLLEAPDSTLAVVYIDADDETSGIRFASADVPFNEWLRERMRVAVGLDISQTRPAPMRVHDSAL
jgi:hypothetical protein